MTWKSRLKQIILIVYVIQLISSIAFIFWGWKINLNFSELMAWFAVEISTGWIMFEWFRRLNEDYVKKLYEEKTERENFKSKRLKEIDDQLDTVYLPMKDAIKDFQTKIRLNSSNPGLIDNIADLETAFEEIKMKSKYEIDGRIWQIKVRVIGSPSKNNLDTLLNAVNGKIDELKSERQKYV